MKPLSILATAVGSACLVLLGASLRPSPDGLARAAEGDGANAAAGGEGAAPAEVKPLFGRECVLHLRRDALGLAVQDHRKTGWDSINQMEQGQDLAVRGTVVVMDDHWIVLRDAEGRDHWVPQNMILVIDPVSE